MARRQGPDPATSGGNSLLTVSETAIWGPKPIPAQTALAGKERLELRGARIRSYRRGGLGRGSSHASWPTCMDAHVVLVVGGAGEATATVGLGAGVGPLARVGAHVYLADI